MLDRLDPRVRAALATFGPAALILIAQLILFPIPGGVYFLGLTLGLLGALVAVGMALIYRSNRILNFAQSDLGLVPTVLAVNLIVYSGLNYLLALTVGLAAAVVLGSVIELAIIRRFFRAPRLILTVATIGLSQLLVVGSLLIPRIWGREPSSERISVSSDFTFVINPITFRADHLIAVVVAPLALLAVALFLRYTNVGIAVRASAERADRASLLGVPVKRLQTVVWALATVLSFVGVFLRAGIVGLPLISQVSYTALLSALAALMLGRLTNLPAIATSAVALGILEQAVIWNNSENPEVFDPILAVVIVIALVVRKTGQARAEVDTASSWRSADEIRPLPRELRRVPEVMAVRWGGAALLVGFLVWLPTWLGSGDQAKASAVVIFAIIGVSIVVLTGWAGQVSLGQMSFVAFGAAAGAIATKTWGLDLFAALLIAGLVGAVVAVLVGLPALRLQGLFLAVTTLAFAVTTSSFLLNRKHVDWIPRERLQRPPLFGAIDISSERSFFYLCLVCFAISTLAVLGIRRSRTGRVLLALRENERGVQSYGVNVMRAKLSAFALSGFLAAFAGCLFVHLQQSFVEQPYATSESFAVFTSTVVGGLGSLSGGPIGALYFRGGTWFLTFPWTLLPSAIGVLFVLMVLPGGLGGLFFRLRDGWLRSVARRNGIIVPSLLADVRVDAVPLERAEEAAEHHDAEVAHGELVGAGVGSSDPPDEPPPSPPTPPTPPASQAATTGGGPR